MLLTLSLLAFTTSNPSAEAAESGEEGCDTYWCIYAEPPEECDIEFIREMCEFLCGTTSGLCAEEDPRCEPDGVYLKCAPT
jgi:hypothetical protein